MTLRHPLEKASGLGSSGEGSRDWWLQRVTALVLIPLTSWFLFSILDHLGNNHREVQEWIAYPPVSIALILYLGFMLFHAQLGLQVVIEDYVHSSAGRLTCLLLSRSIFLVAGLVAIYSVLSVAV